MRALLMFLTLLLSAANATVSRVTKSTAGSAVAPSATTISDTYAASTATATLLLVPVSASNGIDPAGFSCSDTVGGSATGNIWRHTVSHQFPGHSGIVLWYAYNSATGALVTGATHVVTCNGFSLPAVTVWASAYKGTKTSADPLVTQNGNNGVSSTASLATGSVTPASIGDLIFTAVSVRSQDVPFTSSPIAAVDTIGWISGTRIGIGTGDTTAASTSAVSDTWSITPVGELADIVVVFAIAPDVALVAKGAGHHVVSNTTVNDTFAASTSGATLLLFPTATSSGIDPAGGGITCSDTVGGSSTGNLWHHTTSQLVPSLNGITIWYSYNSGTGALVTGATHVISCTGFTTTPATTGWSYAFSGTQASSDPLASQSGSQNSSAAFRATGNVTPSQAGDLLFSAGTERLQATPYTSTFSGSVDSISWVSGVSTGLSATYQLAANTSAISDTWTMPGTGTIAVDLAVFKAASATASVPKIRRRVIP